MAHADAETRPDTVWLEARLATFAANQPGIGAIERGALAARDGRLVFVGKAIDLRAAAFGKSGHAALKGVRVQVAERRD